MRQIPRAPWWDSNPPFAGTCCAPLSPAMRNYAADPKSELTRWKLYEHRLRLSMTSWKKSFLFWGGDIIIIMSYIYICHWSMKCNSGRAYKNTIRSNVANPIINHPPNHHFYRWYVYHSQMSGLLLFFSHSNVVNPIINWAVFKIPLSCHLILAGL